MARQSAKNLRRLIQASTEVVPVEKDFLQDLKRSIELTDKKNIRESSHSYKPSGMNCIRQSYYQLVGKEPDKEESSYCLVGICNSGSDIHERVQQQVIDMKENGMDCEYVNVADFVESRGLDYLEVRKRPDPSKGQYETKLFNKELNISFLCDGIIRYKGKYYILELKTETQYKWMSRDGVNPEHYNQARTYSLNLGLKDVIFVYISRDNLDMKAFMYTPTKDEKQGILDYIHECDGYVDRNIAPPKPENVSKKACTYCKYKSYCKANMN